MKLIYLNILILLLTSCSTYYQLFSLGGWSSAPQITAWKRNGQEASFVTFSECKKFDSEQSSEGMYDCLYQKGYRFRPMFGYCSYWKDSYL